MADVPPVSPHPFTRCPSCGTVFRVTEEQLARRSGQVRCGQCKAVFDANAQRVSHAPAPRPVASDSIAEAAPGPSPVVPRESDAHDAPEGAIPDVRASTRLTIDDEPGREATHAEALAPERRISPGRAMAAGYAAVIVLLALLLGAQALFHYSSAIAAHWPGTAPILARVCETLGCSVRPLHDAAMQHLSIDASDLQADPAHRGLLILTATLRNRAGWTLAYPHLELTLTDSQDRIVVRRALAPPDYAGGTIDVAKGIAANGEVNVRLFIDASSTVQAGYRLYMFYP